MIKTKKKICKGTGRAKGLGCGISHYMHMYGLCTTCFKSFLYNSEEGKKMLDKTLTRAKKIANKPQKRKYTKWVDKPTNEMIQYLQSEIVNPYIRLRDIEKHGAYNCISGGGKVSDAGHFYNVKNNQRLRFCIQNIHGQSYSHNRDTADPGHINEYRKGLINRFGEKYLKELEQLKASSNNWPKFDKIDLIEIGRTYEYLTKKRIWCFKNIEFENYRKIINK